MTKILLIIFSCISFTSCLTQKKVTGWLDDHKTEAAGYCADNFPPDTITRTVTQNIDSAGYFDAYMNMSYLADSLLNELQRRAQAATPDKPYKPNVDSLRKIVDKEIRRRLKPCVDTVKVVTNTVIDRAREKQLRGFLGEKDQVITGQQQQIVALNNKVRSKNKWVWMFWGLVVLIGGYAFAKIRFKLPI